MGLFNRMREPIFLKESSDLEARLETLRELEPRLNSEGRAKLYQEMKYLEYGLIGEQNIAFELRNSHMPMVILHDLYLEDGDLSAQIDYLVFTRKLCFVIECKNLYGDIEIDNSGAFIRTMELGGKRRKEGIYSPVTQNQRHLELMKKILLDRENNIFKRRLKEKYFDDFYRSVVVLANPRTVLYARYAEKKVRDSVIRADQLVAYIKKACDESQEEERSDRRLREWGESFLRLHVETEHGDAEKYEPYRGDGGLESSGGETGEAYPEAQLTGEAALENSGGQDQKDGQEDKESLPLEETAIYKELKGYRLAKSREEQVRAYYIFNNEQLRQLIENMPRTKEELRRVPGFGETKVNKYGDAILSIIQTYLCD